jgi:hypothetical protein
MTRVQALQHLEGLIGAQIADGLGLSPAAAEHARALAAHLEQPERCKATPAAGNWRKRASAALARWSAVWTGYPVIPGMRKAVMKEAESMDPRSFAALMDQRIEEDTARRADVEAWQAARDAKGSAWVISQGVFGRPEGAPMFGWTREAPTRVRLVA